MDGEGYDGGYGGGGGFAATSQGAGGGAGGSGAKGKGGSKIDFNSKTIIPVTVKQLCSASQVSPNDPFTLDGRELTHVRVIGKILQLEDDASSCRVLLHDSTGVAQFQIWTTEMGAEWMSTRATWEHNKYLEIIAGIKGVGGGKALPVYHHRLVTDPNMITKFLLDTIYAHLYNTRGPLAAPGAMPYGAAAAAIAAQGIAEGDNRISGMSPECLAVLAIYKDTIPADPDAGLAIAEAMKLGRAQGLSAEAVQRATQVLMMDGVIYSTTDDTHYRAT